MTYLSQLYHKYYLHKVLQYKFKYLYVSFTSHKKSQEMHKLGIFWLFLYLHLLKIDSYQQYRFLVMYNRIPVK